MQPFNYPYGRREAPAEKGYGINSNVIKPVTACFLEKRAVIAYPAAITTNN